MPDDADLDAEMFLAERQIKAAHEELTQAEEASRATRQPTGYGHPTWQQRRAMADRVIAARTAYAAAFAALQKAEGAAL